MTHFINAKESLVTEAIDGFLTCRGGGTLARLDGYPSTKVIVSTEAADGKVALISGGGAGHEPAHLGLVGTGLLRAAVCGDVFASPSVDAVLDGIMAVTGDAGCLLIVKNYTGDRLNFGLAAEKARALGKKVEMVIVADDIALPESAQPRGVAGTVFVHKIAGHFADQGLPLDEIAQIARDVAGSAVTLGISLSSCSVPGAAHEQRIPAGTAELGLGIHGEPGVERIRLQSASQIAATLLERLSLAVKPAQAYALLLNNLGATTPLEMSVMAHEILGSEFGAKIKLVVGPAQVMTALDMHGLSVSLLPLIPDYEAALCAPVDAAGWPGCRPVSPVAIVKAPKREEALEFQPSRNPALRRVIEAGCAALISAETELNFLDSKIGDGDTGSTMAGAARTLLEKIDALPLSSVSATFHAISALLSRAMGGSSGVLLAILFEAAGVSARDGNQWSDALMQGLAKMKHYGGAKAGDRTMIDVLEPAIAALVSNPNLQTAAHAARAGAEATKHMKSARAGRASYVSAQDLLNVADPGAEAVARVFEALAQEGV